MLNAGVLNDLKVFFEKTGVLQGSELASFLVNVYLNELDLFVLNLSRSKSVYLSKAGINKSVAQKEYKRRMEPFSTARIASTLKKYGSVEALKRAKNFIKKEFFDKYVRNQSTERTVRRIQYVRYAEDVLIGVVGPRAFARDVEHEITSFIKGNLQLDVSKVRIVNRSESSVTFLRHLIYLKAYKEKGMRIKSNYKEAAVRYKKRIAARLAKTNALLAKSASSLIKASLIKVVEVELRKIGGK